MLRVEACGHGGNSQVILVVDDNLSLIAVFGIENSRENVILDLYQFCSFCGCILCFRCYKSNFITNIANLLV